jgi:hypothetical protein
MTKLVESILSGDYSEANQLFADRIDHIKECKLYEAKKQLQAEAFGGKSPEQIKSQPGYRGRASDVLGLSPYDKSREDKKKRIAAQAAEKKQKSKSTGEKASAYLEKQRKKQSQEKDKAVVTAKQKTSKAKPEPKEKAKPVSKPDYENTPTGRNRQKADAYAAKRPPGSLGLKIAKGIGKAASFVARDIVGSLPG